MDDKTSRKGPEPADQPLGEGAAWSVLSYLISGPLLYGGIGWALDRWWGTRFLAPVGIVLGMGVAIYTVWVRYGRVQHAPTPGTRRSAPGPSDQSTTERDS